MENAGQRLCKYREHLKLTQYEFSRLYGIKQQSLSKYENGHLSIPDDLKIKLLQKGVNLNWLLTGTGSMFLEQPENTHSSNVPVRTREEERIKQLENELDSLKKNIQNLQAECDELAGKNQELNSQLRLRLQELISAKDDLIKSLKT